ncbi:MAG: thioredoxin fold domain-containing protein [Myxococcaceae bacterium]|nr:thioredoxin fold domain-containing protein [Myxococcaceae bacterium]
MSLELPGIFLAGLLTFVSPCILPLVPLYLSLLGGASISELEKGGQGSGRLRIQLLVTAVAFALGLGAVFVALGLAATAVGHALLTHRALLLQLGGLVVFLFGLKFLGVLRLPFLEREARPLLQRLRQGSTVLGAFLFGAAFALGWTPCVGPVLGSVLTFTASRASHALEGAAYLGAYAAGLSVPLIAAAAAAPSALRLVARLRPQLRRFELVTGVLLMAMGLLLLTDNLERLTPSLPSPAIAAHPAAPVSDQAMSAVLDSALPVAAHAAPTDGGEAAMCRGDAPGGCALPDSVADEDAAPEALPSGRAMVEFVSRACPVCQRMAPVVAAAEHDCAGRHVQVKRVDVSDPAGAALARRFGVRGVPTFVMLDEGREVARLVGEQPLAQLTQSLEVLTGERCDGFRTIPPR